MKIYECLKQDHEELKDILGRLVQLEDSDVKRFELLEEVRDALIPHSRAEEAVFYNSIRALDADSGKIMHGYKEHIEAEGLLRALQVQEKVNLGWKATARKLKEAIEHHIQEEETQIFDLARKLLSDDDAEKIGVAFEKMKPEIQKEGMVGTTFEMIKNLMPSRLGKTVKSGASHPQSKKS